MDTLLQENKSLKIQINLLEEKITILENLCIQNKSNFEQSQNNLQFNQQRKYNEMKSEYEHNIQQLETQISHKNTLIEQMEYDKLQHEICSSRHTNQINDLNTSLERKITNLQQCIDELRHVNTEQNIELNTMRDELKMKNYKILKLQNEMINELKLDNDILEEPYRIINKIRSMSTASKAHSDYSVVSYSDSIHIDTMESYMMHPLKSGEECDYIHDDTYFQNNIKPTLQQTVSNKEVYHIQNSYTEIRAMSDPQIICVL